MMKKLGKAFVALLSLFLVLGTLAPAFAPSPAVAATDIYVADATWVAPITGCVEVEVWGAGGGGANRSTSGFGGGGGGGAYAYESCVNVTQGNSYTVEAGTAGTSGVAGGDSWFSTSGTVMAKGGSSASTNSASGASGGSAASSIGDVTNDGGTGGTGSTAGGGGGGGGGDSADGGNGTAAGVGGTGGSTYGGDGGVGPSVNGGGGSGMPRGGGGAGSRRTSGTQIGGSGAPGEVHIRYTTLSDRTSMEGWGGVSLAGATSGSFKADAGQNANRVAYVYVSQSSAATVSVTWGGVAMTQISSVANGDRMSVHELIAPPTGVSTVSLSASGGGINSAVGVVYSNVAQTGYSEIESATPGGTTTGTINNLTAPVANSRAITGFLSNGGLNGSFTNGTKINDQITGDPGVVDSGLEAVGEFSMSAGSSFSANWVIIGVVIKPVSAAVTSIESDVLFFE